MYIENPQLEQDRVEVTLNLFNKTGQVIHPEDRKIYGNIAQRLNGAYITEAGCGIGLGSIILGQNNHVLATDVLPKNVLFAYSIYPWGRFEVWDITAKPHKKTDVVVAIEVVEHIRDYKQAIKNLQETAPEVWISTPNRNNPNVSNKKPDNVYHVKEFTPSEMLGMLKGNVEILHWKTFEKVDMLTEVTPLVYRVTT